MSVLAVPDTGLILESSADSSNSFSMQAFGIALNDSVIEDMIRCVQNGKEIKLSLGDTPTFHYASQEHRIKPASDSSDYDLYLTNPYESASKAQRLPNPTMSILKQLVRPKAPKPKVRVEEFRGGKQGVRAGSSGPESDAESLANSYARERAQKAANATKPVTGTPAEAKRRVKGSKKLLPPGRKGAMASVMSSNGTARSLPSSPALTGVQSPSLNPAFTASQQVYEKNKDQRVSVVHELAVRDRSLAYLAKKWTGSEAELRTTLGKVADSIDGKWSLKKLFWKELDVWNYDYDTQEERQLAIDSAIKVYDKQRLGTTAPEWERLLKKEERGKGKVLSKLQATLARGNITPLPKPLKTEDGSKNSSDESSKGKGGEAMARSNSQPVGSKPKAKGSDRDAQTKRMLSSKPKKPTPPVKKAAAVGKIKAAEKSGKQALSEEYVHSSSSEDEAPLSTSKSKPAKAVDKAVERPIQKTVEKDPPVTKPKGKPVVRAPKGPMAKPHAAVTANDNGPQKRAREVDDNSSSSGAPLSKRAKTKERPKLPTSTTTKGVKHRQTDVSQNSRTTSSSTGSSNLSHKTKNTSPAKSSPLASSPPTNASDFDDSSQHTQSQTNGGNRSQSQTLNHHPRTNGITNGNHVSSSLSKKCKDRDVNGESPMPPTKRARVGHDILEKALKFEMYYRRYESLHHDLIAEQQPPQDQVGRLLEMRERLVELKNEITREVSGAN